jgi:hypothetical protein
VRTRENADQIVRKTKRTFERKYRFILIHPAQSSSAPERAIIHTKANLVFFSGGIFFTSNYRHLLPLIAIYRHDTAGVFEKGLPLLGIRPVRG